MYVYAQFTIFVRSYDKMNLKLYKMLLDNIDILYIIVIYPFQCGTVCTLFLFVCMLSHVWHIYLSHCTLQMYKSFITVL